LCPWFMQRILGLKMVTVDLDWDAAFRFVNLSAVCALIALAIMARNLATKNDVEMIVHASVKDLATEESLKDLATEGSLKDLATEESLKDLASEVKLRDEKYRRGLLYLAKGINALRTEKQADIDEQIFGDQRD
jgi:hypothetical protein